MKIERMSGFIHRFQLQPLSICTYEVTSAQRIWGWCGRNNKFSVGKV